MPQAHLSGAVAESPRRSRGGTPASRHSLDKLLSELQYALDEHFFDYRHSGRPIALGRLKLGVELLCKLEDQLLLPALRASRDADWPEIDKALEEVEMLRDLTTLLDRTLAEQQYTLVPAIEGVAQLHFASMGELLADADTEAVPWGRLEGDMREQLAAWHAEVSESGELEDDEDEDPVGEPPR